MGVARLRRVSPHQGRSAAEGAGSGRSRGAPVNANIEGIDRIT
jgi:hypothetical protein